MCSIYGQPRAMRRGFVSLPSNRSGMHEADYHSVYNEEIFTLPMLAERENAAALISRCIFNKTRIIHGPRTDGAIAAQSRETENLKPMDHDLIRILRSFYGYEMVLL